MIVLESESSRVPTQSNIKMRKILKVFKSYYFLLNCTLKKKGWVFQYVTQDIGN